jgi:ABC-type multidrug transport system ATPase subunit
VYQEDLFFPTMTVKEHLVFHAMVRMPGSIPVEKRLERVESVLMEVRPSISPPLASSEWALRHGQSDAS